MNELMLSCKWVIYHKSGFLKGNEEFNPLSLSSVCTHILPPFHPLEWCIKKGLARHSPFGVGLPRTVRNKFLICINYQVLGKFL
jgi:hypothetical protein